MLWKDNLEETLEFYTIVLGFKVSGKNDDWAWANIYKDNVEIRLAKPNEHEPFDKPVFTGSFYFNTDDVDGLWQELKDKAKVCYAIENFEWDMREFAIYDNNGYLLQFGQNIAKAED